MGNAFDCYDVVNAPRWKGSLLPEVVYNLSSQYKSELVNMSDGYVRFAEGEAIWKDRLHPQKKVAIAKKLGFKYNVRSKLFVTPTWLEVASNYHHYMQALGYKEGEYVRPIMVLVKGPRFPLNQKEIIFYDPFVDSPPPNGYRVYDNSEGFNLPSALVNGQLRRGRFPLLKAFHDTSHFMALMRFPWLGKLIVQSMSNWPVEITPALQRRLFWVLETLSLPDSDRQHELVAFLSSVGAQLTPQSLENIQQRYTKMSEDHFLAYSGLLVQFSFKILEDMSAGFFGSSEKLLILDRFFNWKNRSDVYKQSISGRPTLGKVLILSRFLSEESHDEYSFLVASIPQRMNCWL